MVALVCVIKITTPWGVLSAHLCTDGSCEARGNAGEKSRRASRTSPCFLRSVADNKVTFSTGATTSKSSHTSGSHPGGVIVFVGLHLRTCPGILRNYFDSNTLTVERVAYSSCRREEVVITESTL